MTAKNECTIATSVDELTYVGRLRFWRRGSAIGGALKVLWLVLCGWEIAGIKARRPKYPSKKNGPKRRPK